MKYQVVRIDNGRDNPPTGVVSTHRTREAAQSAIDKANKSLRKLPGMSSAWHPYDIRERPVQSPGVEIYIAGLVDRYGPREGFKF